VSAGSTAKITIVSGSSRLEGRVHAVVALAADTAASAGAAVEVVALHELCLPVMIYGDRSQNDLPAVQSIRRSAAWADGFIICTPEYHGNMSGCLKNWFDFLYEELAGKFAGVLAVTGGGGGDMSITAVKTSFAGCHGFTLPYHVAARATDFDVEGRLVNNMVADRVRRVAYDVVRYAPVVRGAFEAARTLGPGVQAGVAGAHT
jgi:FMN reductase